MMLVGAFRGMRTRVKRRSILALYFIERQIQRDKVLDSVLLDGNVIVQFVEFFAEIKCKQHIIVKSRLLSCTRSCSELDDVYAKLDVGDLNAGG
jgi:hypothetical protein